MTHLTHGWEPDLGADDSLLRRFTLAIADRQAFVAGALGGRVLRTDAFAASDPVSPVAWDNSAVLLQPPFVTDPLAAAAQLVDFFGPQRGWILFSPWYLPDLTQLGFRLVGHPPCMFRAAGGVAPAVPEGLEIVEVTDLTSFRDWAHALVEGYPMAPDSSIVDERVLGGSVRFFTGYVDGAPVATAGVFTGHGINEVEWISTLPSHRGRGIGAALSWAATMAEPSLPAMLMASDDGRPVYLKMGYEPLVRFTLWSREPE